MSIHALFNLIQQPYLPLQLVADGGAEVALAGDGVREGVELGVLLGEDVRVVGVELGVGEGGVVAVGSFLGRRREEGG